MKNEEVRNAETELLAVIQNVIDTKANAPINISDVVGLDAQLISLAAAIPVTPFAEADTTNLVADLAARLVSANNLSDLTNIPTARSNLGLGTLATQNGTFSGTSSGTNTGDQTIALTGDVTGSGTGTFAVAIANLAVQTGMLADNSVTLTKLYQAVGPMVLGRTTAALANIAGISAGADGDVLRRSGAVLGFGAIPESSVTGLVADLAARLISANNLSDLANAATARTNLGLGTLATQNGTFSGTSSGTNTGDQTITLTGDVTGSGTGSFGATIAALAVTDAKVAAANKDGVAGTASMRTLGTGAQQACAGNDSRLSDSRTPTAHHTTHEDGGADPVGQGFCYQPTINATMPANYYVYCRQNLSIAANASLTLAAGAVLELA